MKIIVLMVSYKTVLNHICSRSVIYMTIIYLKNWKIMNKSSCIWQDDLEHSV